MSHLGRDPIFSGSNLSGPSLSRSDGTGEFKRTASTFRSHIGSSEFPAEPNRYHLYVSLACPWAHRTLIVRRLKGLEGLIGVTVVDAFLDGSKGWEFKEEKDPLHPDFDRLAQIYQLTNPKYEGRVTVPVLFDSKTNQIVNNESSEIIRDLNQQFNHLIRDEKKKGLDLYPEELRSKIDEVNEWIYSEINNGVYKCGFATKQEPYEAAFHALFAALGKVESILSQTRYLTGSQLTEADVRLYTTLIRFDAVYVLHFKTNFRQIKEYKFLSEYLKELYQIPEFNSTTNFHHIKNHYFASHKMINPHGIVPLGPSLNYLEEEHRREEQVPLKK